MGKKRIDQHLVDMGYFESREKAKSALMAGQIYVGEKCISKPGSLIDPSCAIEQKGVSLPYVSRGGLKLEKALTLFPVDVGGKTLLDVGASTGGFTDCLLQKGAKKVYALDVGYNQLHFRLRQDPRVFVMERTNIRYVTRQDFTEELQGATIDVAFISLTKVFSQVLDLLVPEGFVIALIKPQFEAGRDQVGKKGVVRDLKVHREVLFFLGDALQDKGAGLSCLTPSPILGPEGNREYLAFFVKGTPKVDVTALVETALQEVQTL